MFTVFLVYFYKELGSIKNLYIHWTYIYDTYHGPKFCSYQFEIFLHRNTPVTSIILKATDQATAIPTDWCKESGL